MLRILLLLGSLVAIAGARPACAGFSDKELQDVYTHMLDAGAMSATERVLVDAVLLVAILGAVVVVGFWIDRVAPPSPILRQHGLLVNLGWAGQEAIHDDHRPAYRRPAYRAWRRRSLIAYFVAVPVLGGGLILVLVDFTPRLAFLLFT